MILRRRIMADGDGIDYSKQYLTIVSREDNNVIYWRSSSNSSSYLYQITVSVDNGVSWTRYRSQYPTGTQLATLNTGDKLMLKYYQNTYNNTVYNFFHSTKEFDLEGNIMSLTTNYDFTTSSRNIKTYFFLNLFYNCTQLKSAKNLVIPADAVLNDYCFSFMFRGCTSLTEAPEELPPTTLSANCYRSMFQGCTSLTEAPELPATVMQNGCYYSMFQGCESLVTAPELPATTLAQNCYTSMFQGCASLTEAPDILPALTLQLTCYSNMFRNCGSLERAPELPATTLVQSCYQNMFYNSPSLNYIKCLAVNKSASNCTSNWVSDVAEEGVFEKSSGVSWSTGSSGIPSGWTVVEV